MAVADFFLKLEGITGESQDKTHSGELELLSWAWGVSNAGSFSSGTGGGTAKAQFQDMSFTKRMDMASNAVFQFCATGKHIGSGTLTCRKAGGDSPVEYYVVNFTNALVSSYNSSGSGTELPIDHFTLNFEEFQATYTQQAAGGGGEGTVQFGYNISAHETA
jgi:type VI secretion system secreted protein Hcp